MNRFARFVSRSAAPVLRRGSFQGSLQLNRRGFHGLLATSRVATSTRLQPQRSVQPQFIRCFSEDAEVINVKVPEMGDSIEEGTIVEWVKGPGDWVRVDDIIVLVETDKVVVEVRAENEGQIMSVHAAVDDNVDVGSPLLDLAPGPVPEGEVDQTEEAAPEVAAAPTPAAAPTQPEQQAAPQQAPMAAPKAAPAPAANVEEPAAGERVEERVKMSRMRQTIAKNLKNAQNTAALLTSFQEVDMSALIDLRKKHKDAFEAKFGTKLGFMSPFMKACGLALQEVPAVNSQLDADDNIVYRNYSDISVAVATPTGLVMPVVRNCHSQSLAGMEADLNDLATRARNREIAMEEMQGGTFSISNGGIFGSLMGTPILFAPQTAILGMHATKMRAVVDQKTGEVVARPMMYLALTYDHRLIDGREAVTFLVSVRDKIEDPHRMLLGL